MKKNNKTWVFGYTVPLSAVYRTAMSVEAPVMHPQVEIDRQMVGPLLDRVLETLTTREAGILRLRFGLGSDPQSLVEIGKRFNITRKRVLQIEAKALRKLRHPIRVRQIESLAEILGLAV